MNLPHGWQLTRRRAAGYGDFRWLVHRCGWTSRTPVDLALTGITARQIIAAHTCHPAPAAQVIHGQPCPREHL